MKRLPAVSKPRRSVVQSAYDFLQEEGCSPRLLTDASSRFSEIAFQYDGQLFVAGVDERDPDFLDVSLRLRFDPTPDEVTALRVANGVQGTHKVVKIGVERNASLLRFGAPVFLRGLPPSRSLLERCVGLLRHTAFEFDDLLRGTAKARA